MIFEYALEPDLLNNWKDFRYFIDQFGISKGRLISRYPKRWKRMVFESIEGIGDRDKHRIIEALAKIDKKLLPRENEWDDKTSWLDNAEIENKIRPFHAIIAHDNPNKNSHIIVGDDVDEKEPLWESKTQEDIPRKPHDMADAVSILLRQSRHIVFIDTNFGPENTRHRRPLFAFIKEALNGRKIQLESIEYHTEAKSDLKFFTGECESKIAPNIPVGIDIHFKRWSKKVGGTKLHDRFILTDIGGVEFTVGLDDGPDGEETGVILLEEGKYQNTCQSYLSDTPDFELVDEVVINGSKP